MQIQPNEALCTINLIGPVIFVLASILNLFQNFFQFSDQSQKPGPVKNPNHRPGSKNLDRKIPTTDRSPDSLQICNQVMISTRKSFSTLTSVRQFSSILDFCFQSRLISSFVSKLILKIMLGLCLMELVLNFIVICKESL